MKDGPKKRRHYAKLVVDAFRIKARTIKFLRGRLLTDGRLEYDVDGENEIAELSSYDYTPDFYKLQMQPFEQVWVLFEEVLVPKYNAQNREGPILVIDLLGDLQN